MLDLVEAHSIGASVDRAVGNRVAGNRVGCNRLVLDRQGQVHLLAACQLEDLVEFALAGGRDTLELAAGRIAVDMEGTADRGCKQDGQMYNQMLRLAWHKPTNFAVFLQFSRSQPHVGPYF